MAILPPELNALVVAAQAWRNHPSPETSRLLEQALTAVRVCVLGLQVNFESVVLLGCRNIARNTNTLFDARIPKDSFMNVLARLQTHAAKWFVSFKSFAPDVRFDEGWKFIDPIYLQTYENLLRKRVDLGRTITKELAKAKEAADSQNRSKNSEIERLADDDVQQRQLSNDRLIRKLQKERETINAGYAKLELKQLKPLVALDRQLTAVVEDVSTNITMLLAAAESIDADLREHLILMEHACAVLAEHRVAEFQTVNNALKSLSELLLGKKPL